MAWRIHTHVVRGEIDNREKGKVMGRIWIEGRDAPIVLNLTGNACKDLAGTLLTFKNQGEITPMPGANDFYQVQEGRIGDLTASRKVRVFDIPVEEAYKMLKEGEKPPEHMSNSLYLEWFSLGNGRVVIESVDYELNLSAPQWQLTDEEDRQRAKDAMEGFSGFMGKMEEALEQAKEKVDYEKEDWDEHDYERFLKESDALTDKYMELIEKFGDKDDSQEIIGREMGWEEKDDEDEESVDWEEAQAFMEAEELIPDSSTEGIDWIRTDSGDIRHPLQHQCYQQAIALGRDIKDPEKKKQNEEVANLKFEYQMTAVKMAGALNSLAYGRGASSPAFIIASLKRALSHLHKAQALLEIAEEQVLLAPEIIQRVRTEFFEMREGILKLMDEFRGRSIND